jgi:gliding-associated putative ABC transporter substrate-binding component GldG
MAMNKRTRIATESLVFLGLLVGILFVLNLLGAFAFARADLTENNAFSLSDGSKKVARELRDKAEIIMYFTEDLPPPFNATERYVHDLLVEYENASEGQIDLKVVHPDTEELKKQAREDGAQEVRHQVVENDSVKVKQGFRTIVIKYLGDTKKIQVGRDTQGLEYDVTMALKELLAEKHDLKKPIGIVKGHGSPKVSKELGPLKQALPTYELKQVSLDSEIDPDLAALLVIGPTEKLSNEELKQIDRYVMNGGSLGVFGGRIKLNKPSRRQRRPQSLSASIVDSNINRLLSRWGVRVEGNMVADQNCDRVPMRGQMGMRVAVPYPPMPVLSFDEAQQEHPVTFRLKNARLPFSSALDLTGKGSDEANVQVLGKTSKNSWLMTGGSIALQPKRPEEWKASGKNGPFPVMAAVEGKLNSAFSPQSSSMSTPEKEKGQAGPLGPKTAKEEVRVFVNGWGMDMIGQFLRTSGRQGGGRQQLGGLASLTLNAVDWLAQDSDLIAIRAKDIEDPKLDVPKDVGLAEEKAREAKKEAQKEAKKAAKKGDRAKAQQELQEGQQEVKQALEERKQAMKEWEQTKSAHRWGNLLGIPLAFALFGVVRWRMRANRKKNIKL